ncbi:Transcription initiation factor iie, alpha subunit, related [Neospora caninum Liverpool]|uniref:Transcription initiation factor iie, alpha subunit, related n=1 Tax=Neospora caninum (strain Liverpool) TaxID=572307 RepID=F0VHZ0_NEOCL|nr:Transcription initiation factor iie, alpha subunit, related [Neospora caninum Liverpool]CBZ53351.1 Transcription initiation factor iie, alpha subunit, related [Neospora caninum Liverpool]|eukprot:XP_003883383.1 Transcription initiation factor iie, alpha subunit, related [Neospora caninum Liverpool]
MIGTALESSPRTLSSSTAAGAASSGVEKSSDAQTRAARAASLSASVVAKPFDRSLFRAFLAAASRLFCDDDQIVIVDFLAHHEKAYTERDLIERLGWPDRRVREACAALERMQLVTKEQLGGMGSAAGRNDEKGASATPAAQANSGAKGSDSVVGSSGSTVSSSSAGGGGPSPNPPAASSSPLSAGPSAASQSAFYFKISPYCLLVFHFRLQRAEQQVEEHRRAAEGRDVFFCPKCSAEYDALEAQLLDVDPRDAHFLCKFCNEKLEHEIPSFPPYSRAERSAYRNRPAEDGGKTSLGGTGSTSGSALGDRGVSSGSGVGAGDDTLSDTSLPGAGSVQLQMRQALAGTAETARRQAPAWVTPEHQAGDAAAAPGRGNPPLARSASAAGVTGVAAGEPAALAARSSAQARPRPGGPTDAAASVRPGAATQRVGGRNQIRFSMKGGSSGTGSKSATSAAFGSKARPAAPKTNAPQLHAGASAQAGQSVVPAATRPSAAASSGLAPSRLTGGRMGNAEAVGAAVGAHADGYAAKPARASAAAPSQREAPEDAHGPNAGDGGAAHADPIGPSGFAAAPAAACAAEENAAGVGGSAAPLFFVGKLGREMTLEEAAEYQLEMTAEEHERFMELQAVYLDDI